MRNDRLVPGLILVLIGIGFLLRSFGIIEFHFWNIVRLWPIILVIAGVNLVFANNRSGWATALKVGVLVLGVGLLLFGDFGRKYNFWPKYHYRYSDNNDNDDDTDTAYSNNVVRKVEGKSNHVEAFTPGTEAAKLNINGGGASFKITDTTDQLFTADTKEFYNRFELYRTKEGNVDVLDFRMRNRKGRFNWDSNKPNSADIKLNAAPIWDFNINAGATALDFDLSKFKVRSFKLSGGAGDFDIKLGQPYAVSEINISTGVSDVEISVPQSAACSIKSSTALSGNHYDGFESKGDGVYQTPGFDKAVNKYVIRMDGGISDFKVKRY
jgi:hypothetical protein